MDDLYSGIIYKYTSPSGKVYIGQTTNERKRRRDFLDVDASYAGDKIDQARLKYGPENFSYEILSTISARNINDLSDLLDFSEQYYIQKYDSCKNGYNILSGGSSIRNWKKTQEQVRKQRESLIEYYKTHRNPNSKKVLQYSLEGKFIREWDSATEAEIHLGYTRGNISNACKGVNKSAMGYMWRYKEDDMFPHSIDPCSTKGTVHKHTGLLQLDLEGNLIKEWKSNKEAAVALNIKSAGMISEVCRGKRKTAGGFIWRYKEQATLLSENKYEI